MTIVIIEIMSNLVDINDNAPTTPIFIDNIETAMQNVDNSLGT